MIAKQCLTKRNKHALDFQKLISRMVQILLNIKFPFWDLEGRINLGQQKPVYDDFEYLGSEE